MSNMNDYHKYVSRENQLILTEYTNALSNSYPPKFSRDDLEKHQLYLKSVANKVGFDISKEIGNEISVGELMIYLSKSDKYIGELNDLLQALKDWSLMA